MTKEKLEKEASNWLRKYLLCCNCEKKCNCIDSNSYCEEQVLKAYVDSAEPREKRIADLEFTNKKISDECHKLVDTLEKKQKEIAELELKIKKLTQHLEPQKMTALFEQVEEEVRQEQRLNELEKENAELKEQVSAMSKALVLNTSDEKLEKAKALIDRFLDFESYAQERGCYIADDTRKQAEAFLKEVEK